MSNKTFNIKFQDLVFWIAIALTGTIVACSNTDALIVDPDQVREDSIVQSTLDNDAIDLYITENNVENVIVTTSGIRYALLIEGSGELPNNNDIVSINLTGKLLDNEIFHTSDNSITTVAGVDVSDIDFYPLRFNHSTDGSSIQNPFVNHLVLHSPLNHQTINTTFVNQFSIGLAKIMNLVDNKDKRLFSLNAKAIMFLPSSSAFGTTGSINTTGFADGIIEPNTVIMYEFNLTSIRP